jgi:hypothetical protein
MSLLTLLLLCIIPLEASHRPYKGAGKNRVPIILNDHRTRKRQKKYHSNRKPRVFRAPPVDEDEVDRLLERHPCASRESVVALVTGLAMVPNPFRDEE